MISVSSFDKLCTIHHLRFCMLVYELWNGTSLSLYPFFSLKNTSNPYFPIEMSCFISSNKKCFFFSNLLKNHGFKIIKKMKINLLKTSNDKPDL